MAVPDSQLGINRFQVVPFNEGGPVIKAQEGRYFSQFDEGDIDLNDILDAMARVESGAAGGQNYFGVPVSPEQMAEVGGVGELSAYQVRPTTLLDFGRGYESYQSIFPEITAQIGDGKKYADAAAAYADPAVKSQVDEYLSDPQRARDAAMGVLAAGYAETGDINKAIEAYNAGLPGIKAGGTNEPYLNKVASAFKEMTQNRTNLLGMIESQTNPIGLGNVYTANKERIDADPVLYEAVMSRMNPASLAVSTTEEVVAEDEVILPSGEVIAKGGVIPAGTVTSVQQADDIGAPVESRGGTVGSIDEPDSEFTPADMLPPTAEDAAAALEAKMNEDLPPAVIMPGDESGSVDQSGDSETGEQKKDDGTNQPESNVTLFGGEAAPQSSIEAEIAKLKGQLEKDRNTDKWLALAQAGMALMSSKEPTLGAAGEAGISGLKAFREAQERYQEGVVDLINAEAKLKDKKSTGITAASAVSRLNKIEEMLNPTDATAMPLPRKFVLGLKRRRVIFAETFFGYADITA